MTTFRAVGLSATSADNGDGARVARTAAAMKLDPDAPPAFVATVAFLEVLDDGKTRELSRQQFTVSSKEELQEACLVVLNELKKQHSDATLALAVSGQTLAEVQV